MMARARLFRRAPRRRARRAMAAIGRQHRGGAVRSAMAGFLLHGIVDRYVHGAHAYRSYVPREAFAHYLQSRRGPFRAWDGSPGGDDVLTVDDATRAGANACTLARRLGHEVIFFVNPYQIATGEPY